MTTDLATPQHTRVIGTRKQKRPALRRPLPLLRTVNYFFTITEEPWPKRPWLAVMPTLAPAT